MHQEIKRRANVVEIFRRRKSVLRLIGTILVEQADDGPWPSVASNVLRAGAKDIHVV